MSPTRRAAADIRDPKWEAFAEVLKNKAHLKKGKVVIFTESKETAEYLAAQIAKAVEPKVLVFTGVSHESVRAEVIANFDAKVRHPKDDYRILIATEVLSEGVNLHRSQVVINYDIPWNPILRILRGGIPREFMLASPASNSRLETPREVILSSFLAQSP